MTYLELDFMKSFLAVGLIEILSIEADEHML